MGRRISSLFLAVLLFAAACPASVLAENGTPAGTQETIVFGGSVSENSMGSGEIPGEGNPEEPGLPGMGDPLPVWDESQELMLYGLADAAAYESRAAGTYDRAYWDSVIDSTVKGMRNGKAVVLDGTFLKGVSSTATDWYAFDLARLGVKGEPYGDFVNKAENYVKERYGDPEKYPNKMSNDKYTATEWHRLTVALQAASLWVDGVDVTNIEDDDKRESYDLIKDGTYNCVLGSPSQQGPNGTAWALIAMDTKGYEAPEDAPYGRDVLIGDLLKAQQPDGGWGLSGEGSGVDITGMVLQALAPYSTGDERVKGAVEKGVQYLRNAQALSQDGSLGNCESTAQAIVAFTALGMDPAKEESFSGDSLLDGLMAHFYNKEGEEGGFCHEIDADGGKQQNRMATEQALYAIAAYTRFLDGDTSLYDFREHSDTTEYKAADTLGHPFFADAGAKAVLTLAPDVETIVLTHLPLGDYDAAVVTDADGKTYKTSFRRADGSIPVEGEIPVKNKDVLKIAVTRQDGTTEAWTLTVETSDDAAVKAVKNQINKLPGKEKLTLSDKDAVEAARKAYDGLTPEQRKTVDKALTEKLDVLEAKLKQLEDDAKAQLTKKREEFEQKVNAIPDVVGISDRDTINGYRAQLDSMGDWEGKAALKAKLDGFLKAIDERQALVEQVDDSIWNGIDPLNISQDDTETVKKLMAAIVIITGAALGAESGFLCGALAGFVSNFFFGQGPWTPWQMFALGIIGFLAGLIFRRKRGKWKRFRTWLCVYGGAAVFAIYGVIMDSANIASVLVKGFRWEALVPMYISGLPMNLIHGTATVVFLAILGEPMMGKLERIKKKYGIMEA